MEINKQNKLTELKDYIDSLSDKYHAKYTNQARGIMWNIKSKGNLTNEELAFLLGIPENKIESMLHETWDGHMSTKLVTKLQLLSCGVFGLPGCQMRKTEIDTINDQFDKILCPVPEEPENEEVFDIYDGYTPDKYIIDRLLSIFSDDKEFQDHIRSKYQEYKERAEETAKNLGDKLNRAKEYSETAKKIADITRTARGIKEDITNRLHNNPDKDAGMEKTPEPAAKKKTDEAYTATVKIDDKNGVSGKAYYLGEDGEMHPISLDEVFKKFGDFFSKLTD